MKLPLVLAVLCASVLAVAAEDKPRVLLEEIKPLDDKQRIIVPAKVEARIQSVVVAETEGHVTRIVKPLGSTVRAGEVVLYLENKDPGFTYAAVPVRSPVAGVVSQMAIAQMTKAFRGDKLFTVINPKSLKLTAEFPSNELGIVKAGQAGLFKSESASGQIPLKIAGVSPLVDARTGTASAELEFVGKTDALPPIGTIGQAIFEISRGSVFLIPETSLIFRDGKPMVRLLKDANKLDKRPVELGEQRDGSFVVKSGLAAGDRVIVRSNRPLKDGETVDIEKNEATR